MLGWIAASISFFIYVVLSAPFVRGLGRRRRVLATTGSLAGIVLGLVAHVQPQGKVLHEWILPPVLLLLGYWSSGLLFAAPMPTAERLLERGDSLLAIDRIASGVPRPAAELLELSYALVYPLIPLAFAIHVIGSPQTDPDRFWTVILITDYVCFGCLPWIQTRPPRAFRTADPWISRFRRLNLRILGKASIQVNTFPSGHAAEGVAVALLVLGAPWPWVVFVALIALLISAGAVLGRYHYAADIVAGWIVAVAVWTFV